MELGNLNERKLKALEKAKDIFESIFDISVDAYEYEEYTEGNVTKFRENKYISGMKCGISYRDKALMGDDAGADGDIYMGVSKEMKLYLPVDVELKKGSKIILNLNGKEVCYKNSGEPAVYKTHQEVGIKLWDRWG